MKIITVILTFVLLVSLFTLSVGAIDVPTSATPLELDYYLRLISSQYPYNNWYSSDTSTLLDEWQDGSLNDQSPIVYPAVIFGNEFNDYVLRGTTTYYMQFELTTQSEAYFYGLTSNASFFKLVTAPYLIDIFGNYTTGDTQAVSDPRDYHFKSLSDISRDITTQVSQVGSQTYRVGFIFSTKGDIEESQFRALLLTSIGTLDESDRLVLKSFEAWTDENLSIYEDLVAGKLDDINGSINDVGNKVDDVGNKVDQAADQITGALDDLNDTMIGEPIEDNTGFSDELNSLTNIENSIKESVFNNITIDNESIAIDSNILNSAKDFIVSKYNPETYNATAGSQLSKVFETFMPYVGIVVWFNLMLALALGFVRGRSNA